MIHLGLRVAFERTWHTVPSNTSNKEFMLFINGALNYLSNLHIVFLLIKNLGSLFLFPCTHFKVKAVSCKNNIMKEKNNSSLLTTQQAEVWIAKLVPEEKQMLLDILVKDTSTSKYNTFTLYSFIRMIFTHISRHKLRHCFTLDHQTTFSW